MKTVQDINLQTKSQRWLGKQPTLQTNPEVKQLNQQTSSKAIPENNATSKAEYTNTQQGLPVNRYNIVHLTRHARLFGLRGLFCQKATKSKSLITNFSFPYSSSVNQSK